MDVDGGGNKRVFQRLTGPSSTDPKNQKVCYHWRAGKCNRFPCHFLHRELHPPAVQPPNGTAASSKRHHAFAAADDHSGPRRGPNNNTWGRVQGNKFIRKTEKVCNYWVQGNCSYGDKCKFLHSWSLGDSFSLLTQLEGHQKVSSDVLIPINLVKFFGFFFFVGFMVLFVNRLLLGLHCHLDLISFIRGAKMRL